MMKSHFNVREYWEDRLGKDYSIQGVGYKGYGEYFNYWMYRVRKFVFKRAFKKLNFSSRSLKVLDVGCGTGFYLEILRKMGAQNVTGIDITTVAVAHLQKKYPQFQFIQLDISDAASEKKLNPVQYDLITAFDVLFHIVDDSAYKQAFTNIACCLKEGGYLFFSDNFLHGKSHRTLHQVSRSLEDIHRVLKDTGLQVIERIPMFIVMNTPVDIHHPFWTRLWITAMLPVRLLNILGLFYGVILFPLELLMVSVLKESPTTEMMICRKGLP
jgi:2-polyprenyl-3-methyl-5-hydroxy-6-metoxy-1,4-benzoquinol methylase